MTQNVEQDDISRDHRSVAPAVLWSRGFPSPKGRPLAASWSLNRPQAAPLHGTRPGSSLPALQRRAPCQDQPKVRPFDQMKVFNL
jgi:hypothetical protein